MKRLVMCGVVVCVVIGFTGCSKESNEVFAARGHEMQMLHDGKWSLEYEKSFHDYLKGNITYKEYLSITK